MTEYATTRSPNPPILAIEGGELVIKIIMGDQTFVAGVGDGSWFFSQVVEKLVDPALRSAYPRPVEDLARIDYRAAPFASPND